VRRGELTPLFRSVWYDLERRRSAPIEEFMRHRTNKSSSTVTKCIRVFMCSRQQEVRSFFDATIRARGDKGSWTWKNTVRGRRRSQRPVALQRTKEPSHGERSREPCRLPATTTSYLPAIHCGWWCASPHSTRPVLSCIPVALETAPFVSFSPRIATSSSSPAWSVQCVWQWYCLRDCFYRGRFGQGSDQATDSSQRRGCRP
jgi:hypothetical protein